MKFIFGPVPSRRLGLSLGIDILPAKTCNMNCIYCELGRGKRTYSKAPYSPPWQEIVSEIEEYISLSSHQKFDFLTFTASGEPTLHPDLEKLILTAKKLTGKPVTVLTNSSTVTDPRVRRTLGLADVVLPSLDTANQATFQKINRPHSSIKIQRIIEGLAILRKEMTGQMWLEILFVKDINDTLDELLALRQAIDTIRPHKIQLNTVARPPAENWARPVSSKTMEEIRSFLGERAQVVIDFKAQMDKPDGLILESELVDTLRRRPLSQKDIETLFGRYSKTRMLLSSLLKKGVIEEKMILGERFYSALPKD